MKALIALVVSVFLGVALVCLSGFAFLTGGGANAACTTPPGTLGTLNPSRSTVPTVRTANASWDGDQAHNAGTIMGVGASMGVPARGWIIAVATAMQESSLRNLGHLGDANDADSLGLFQQRPSQGWGTPPQITDPIYASTKFYTKLLTIPDWQTMPLTQAAQAVERSGHPNAYAKWEIDATQMFTALTRRGNPSAPPLEGCVGDGPAVVTPPSGFTLPPGTPPAVVTAIMWAFGQLGTPYSFGGDCTASHSGNPARQCDCSSLVQMAYHAAGITLPRRASQQSRVGALVAGPAQLRPGDLLFIPGADGTRDAPGHVAMYLGSGLLIAAPKTGDVVHIEHLGKYWLNNLAVIRRNVESY